MFERQSRWLTGARTLHGKASHVYSTTAGADTLIIGGMLFLQLLAGASAYQHDVCAALLMPSCDAGKSSDFVSRTGPVARSSKACRHGDKEQDYSNTKAGAWIQTDAANLGQVLGPTA